MDPEPLRFLRPIDSEDQSTIDTEGEDTSSILSDGVPYRMNNTDLNEERIDESCIDNNDNQGTFDQIFISVENLYSFGNKFHRVPTVEMSVSKGFVLDDDGIHGNFSSKDSSAYSASENDFLEQKLGKMMQKCNFENQNAVQQTIQNLQKFTKLSGNGAYSILLPLISLIKEKDNDSFKQVADHDDVVKRIRVSWQEEREGRKRIPNFVMKICEWMLDNGLRSVEELEEEWKAAQQRRLDLISLLEDNTVQLECARKRAYDQSKSGECPEERNRFSKCDRKI
ncbi:Protein CBG20276 [Caenorhabditis briggsae]|uniref:Protein CBG20276 n=1 Tax=Caenorhabditis briggsae TaxID=6238 RepID=A8XXH2_CAEBR|nr:Protein CBG20276 [Caenorhabditis briggsae]CAP37318.1 Protein CBG20276 [Caenorhabditis briggsae]